MTSFLRPDERAAESEIERSTNLSNTITKGVGALAGIGTAAVGAKISSKILPFLNQYIPTDLAVKGISKLSPKLGEFLKQGQSMGLDVKEGLNFIKDKMKSSEEPAKENRNIIQQYSDELYSFLDQNIKSGKKIIESVAAADMDPKFKKIVNKIEQDHKTPFTKIAQSIFKENQASQMNPSSQQQNPQGAINQLLQQSQGMQQQNPQTGQGQAALMAILQKIQQQRGGK
jgi:hypothetical protein